MGAEYKKAQRTNLSFLGLSMGANLTRYFTEGQLAATEVVVSILIPYNGILRHLYVGLSAAPGAGETQTFTVMINGNASTITAQIGGAVDTAGNDLVHEEAVIAGDLVSIRVVSSVGAAATSVKASLILVG